MWYSFIFYCLLLTIIFQNTPSQSNETKYFASLFILLITKKYTIHDDFNFFITSSEENIEEIETDLWGVHHYAYDNNKGKTLITQIVAEHTDWNSNKEIGKIIVKAVYEWFINQCKDTFPDKYKFMMPTNDEIREIEKQKCKKKYLLERKKQKDDQEDYIKKNPDHEWNIFFSTRLYHSPLTLPLKCLAMDNKAYSDSRLPTLPCHMDETKQLRKRK